jgi:hypothetical protein
MRALFFSLLWLAVFCVAVRVLFRPILASLPFLRKIYFLRVPILTTAIVWIFCLAALVMPGTKLLLGNTFDLVSGTFVVGPDLDIASSSMQW